MSNSLRHESHPRWHKSARNNPIDIIYKYVAGGSGSVLSGNNIRPFKYIQVVGVICVILVGRGKVNKKKENSTHGGGVLHSFLKKNHEQNM